MTGVSSLSWRSRRSSPPPCMPPMFFIMKNIISGHSRMMAKGRKLARETPATTATSATAAPAITYIGRRSGLHLSDLLSLFHGSIVLRR